MVLLTNLYDGFARFLSAIFNPTTIISVVGIIYTGHNVQKQIRISRQPFLIFKLQDVDTRRSNKRIQNVENIGSNTAVNVNVYRCFLDITSKSFWHDKIYSFSTIFLKDKIRRNMYSFADVTLERSLGTFKVGISKKLDLKPISDNYEIFIVQYQDMLGNYYQTLLRPQNGRGDYEKVFPPKKIAPNKRIKNTFIGKTERIALSSFLKQGYE
ncbi:hypothetical protein ACI78P_05085 [Leuconostoc mesenteroides]|uniref:hypothetical protein n=1 Tax=Leuconostoc mesenteroides TaxID=1245 RepID=UPI00385E2F5E